jgi:hypothetical protein
MSKCEVCGNEYDKAFQPECSHCHCKIIGHGTEANGKFFCCAHCAAHAGTRQMQDRADDHSTNPS